MHCLAKGEIELESIFVADCRVRKSRLHRVYVGAGETHRLQIGQAPPRFPQRRLERDGAAIGCDPFGLTTDGFEHVAVAQPNARLSWRFDENAFVKLNRIFEVTEPAQGRRLEVGMADIIGLGSKHFVKQGEGFCGTPEPPDQQCEIGARGGESGGQLKRAAEQALGNGHPTESSRHLGKHADCLRIERIVLKVCLEQPFGHVEPVLVQSQGRLDPSFAPVAWMARSKRHRAILDRA